MRKSSPRPHSHHRRCNKCTSNRPPKRSLLSNCPATMLYQARLKTLRLLHSNNSSCHATTLCRVKSVQPVRREQLARAVQFLFFFLAPAAPAPTSASDQGITAVAVFDYQAGDDDEISFNPNDVITRIEMVTIYLISTYICSFTLSDRRRLVARPLQRTVWSVPCELRRVAQSVRMIQTNLFTSLLCNLPYGVMTYVLSILSRVMSSSAGACALLKYILTYE